MSQHAQTAIAPVVVDCADVKEVFINGPINVNFIGPTANFVMTTVRPDLAQSMAGGQVTNYIAPVAVRLSMPIETAIELKKLLNRLLPDQPPMPQVSTLKQ